VPGEYQTAIAEHKHFDTVLMTARMMEGQLLAQSSPIPRLAPKAAAKRIMQHF
jgi:hypothetical protein